MEKQKENRHQEMHRTFFYFATIVIVLAALVGFYYFYLLFFPPRVSTLTNITVSPTTVHAGDTLVVKANYCKYIDATSFIIRNLLAVDGKKTVIPLAEVASAAPLGCGKFVTYVMIPNGLPKGVYQVQLTIEYQATPVRATFEEFTSQSFKIN